MERIEAGGARAERVRARRTKLNEGAKMTISSAIAELDRIDGVEAATATTAGLMRIFQSGHGAGRTDVWVPESVSIIAAIIMQ